MRCWRNFPKLVTFKFLKLCKSVVEFLRFRMFGKSVEFIFCQICSIFLPREGLSEDGENFSRDRNDLCFV